MSTDNDEAQYLPLAHRVITISAEGRLQQGAYQDVKYSTYLNDVEEADSKLEKNEDQKEAQSSETVFGYSTMSNEAKDLTRQSGDIEVYKYYFKSIGYAKMLVFVFFCILNVFSGCFSGERHPSNYPLVTLRADQC